MSSSKKYYASKVSIFDENIRDFRTHFSVEQTNTKKDYYFVFRKQKESAVYSTGSVKLGVNIMLN